LAKHPKEEEAGPGRRKEGQEKVGKKAIPQFQARRVCPTEERGMPGT
jgi:hypothetical protein